MYGLSSCLPQPFYALVEATWRELERELGLTGIMETAFFPHFTWLLAEGRDFERAWAVVSEIAQGMQPFALRTTGLGLFVNAKIVVHVPIVKTAELARLHALFWEGLAEVSTVRYTLYAPEAWMPHVSLVHEELEPGLVGRVMERLAGRAFDWDMVIDNVVLVDELAGARGTPGVRRRDRCQVIKAGEIGRPSSCCLDFASDGHHWGSGCLHRYSDVFHRQKQFAGNIGYGQPGHY